MRNGSIVFDAVVHTMDFRDEQHINDDSRAAKETMRGFLDLTGVRGQTVSYEGIESPPDFEWANRMLFDESDTDLALVQPIPAFGIFKDGMAPPRLSYEISQTRPERYLLSGGVDPIFQGLRGALEEMERQVEEWGAISMKFYQAQTIRHWWSADDEKIAYPLFEKAAELGIKTVQFHKGLPIGPAQRVEHLKPNDLQQAAYDFPQLNFAIHHFGEPYVDETINIVQRFTNMYLIMPLWFNQYFVQPREMMHRLGKALLFVGEDRICYGTDAWLWPHVQSYIDILDNMEMPEELQDGYGYPEVTEEAKKKIFGENYAKALGVDLEEKARELGLK